MSADPWHFESQKTVVRMAILGNTNGINAQLQELQGHVHLHLLSFVILCYPCVNTMCYPHVVPFDIHCLSPAFSGSTSRGYQRALPPPCWSCTLWGASPRSVAGGKPRCNDGTWPLLLGRIIFLWVAMYICGMDIYIYTIYIYTIYNIYIYSFMCF